MLGHVTCLLPDGNLNLFVSLEFKDHHCSTYKNCIISAFAKRLNVLPHSSWMPPLSFLDDPQVQGKQWTGGGYIEYIRTTGVTETGGLAMLPWDAAGREARFAPPRQGLETLLISQDRLDEQPNRDLDVGCWLEKIRTGGNLLSIRFSHRVNRHHRDLVAV